MNKGEHKFSYFVVFFLGQLTFAGFEPLFMFHHAQVDKIAAVFLQKMHEDGKFTWTPQTVLESFEPISDFRLILIK